MSQITEHYMCTILDYPTTNFLWSQQLDPDLKDRLSYRASSVMFVFNCDFRYVRTYVYICVAVRHIRMLNSSLLGNEEKLRGPGGR